MPFAGTETAFLAKISITAKETIVRNKTGALAASNRAGGTFNDLQLISYTSGCVLCSALRVAV